MSMKIHFTKEDSKNISVIVPVFNGEATIRSCLKALVNQTYEKRLYTIIVVDDGSTDKTRKVVEKFINDHLVETGDIPHMRLISQDNRGPASARNHGISHADGEIVLSTDADCQPDTHWIEHMLSAFDSPNVAAVMGNYGTNQVEILAVFVQKEYEQRFGRLVGCKNIDVVFTHSAGFKRWVFDKIGKFDTSFPCANNEDTEFSYRLAKAGLKIAFAPDAIVLHQHPNTLFSYLKTKTRRAYWRTLVYRRYPEKILRDSYTPQLLKVQILLVFGFYFNFLSIPFHRNFELSTFCLIFLIFVFFVSTLPSLKYIPANNVYLKLVSPFIIFMRAMVMGWGVIGGMIIDRRRKNNS